MKKYIIAGALCLCFAAAPALADCVEVIVPPGNDMALIEFEAACPGSTAVTVSPGSSQANDVVAADGCHLAGTPGGLDGTPNCNGPMSSAVSVTPPSK